jgi:hypothetical protein
VRRVTDVEIAASISAVVIDIERALLARAF